MEKIALFLILLPVLCLAYHDTCVPECVQGAKSPLHGGQLCRCTPEAVLPGCQMYACKPGQDSSGSFTCMCTPENHQRYCAKYRCNNSTISASSSGQEAGVDSTTCNKMCTCGQQPPDCTATDGHPINGAPECSCNMDHWRTGCTLKPCKEGDSGDYDYFCECTKEHSPDFCFSPLCTSLLD